MQGYSKGVVTKRQLLNMFSFFREVLTVLLLSAPEHCQVTFSPCKSNHHWACAPHRPAVTATHVSSLLTAWVFLLHRNTTADFCCTGIKIIVFSSCARLRGLLGILIQANTVLNQHRLFSMLCVRAQQNGIGMGLSLFTKGKYFIYCSSSPL